MSDDLAALREAMVQDSVASVRALAAAGRAVEEGRLNVAILRPSAHASRRRALLLERVLAETSPSIAALHEASAVVGAWNALASAPGDAAVRFAPRCARSGGTAAGCRARQPRRAARRVRARCRSVHLGLR
jgi:hypothetical protein